MYCISCRLIREHQPELHNKVLCHWWSSYTLSLNIDLKLCGKKISSIVDLALVSINVNMWHGSWIEGPPTCYFWGVASDFTGKKLSNEVKDGLNSSLISFAVMQPIIAVLDLKHNLRPLNNKHVFHTPAIRLEAWNFRPNLQPLNDMCMFLAPAKTVASLNMLPN